MGSGQGGLRQEESSRRLELDTLRAMAVDVLLALMECVDHEKIGGPMQYWPTMRKAIRVGAEGAQTWGEWLERARQILKIDLVRADQANLIYSAGESLAARDGWGSLRQLLLDETTLFEVKVRVRKEERKQLSGRTYQLKTQEDGDE